MEPSSYTASVMRPSCVPLRDPAAVSWLQVAAAVGRFVDAVAGRDGAVEGTREEIPFGREDRGRGFRDRPPRQTTRRWSGMSPTRKWYSSRSGRSWSFSRCRSIAGDSVLTPSLATGGVGGMPPVGSLGSMAILEMVAR